MKTRAELEKEIAEKEEAERNDKSRRLAERVKDLLEPVRRAQENLDELIASTKKIIVEKDPAFPPPMVNSRWREQVLQIRSELDFARERVDTIKSRLQASRDEIENPQGAGLRTYTLPELERGLRDKAGGLLGEIQKFRELPEKIAAIEKEIDGLVERLAPGISQAPLEPATVSSQAGQTDNKQIDTFDPRLS